MSTDLMPFEFQGNNVRVATIDGEPWFVAADVCTVLDHRNPANLVRRMDDDEYKVLQPWEFSQVTGGVTHDPRLAGQKVTVFNESGLYSAILWSTKDEAKPFRRWVTHEVIPAIRKSGRYEIQPQQHEIPQSYADALELAARKVREVEALAKRNAELAPMAAEAEHHRAASGLKAVGDFANDLKAWAKTHHPDVKVRHQDVWDHLARLGLVIRGDTIRHNQPTAKAVENGYCVPKVSDFDRPEGPGTSTTTRLTPKGEGYVFDRLLAYIDANGTLELPRRIGGAA